MKRRKRNSIVSLANGMRRMCLTENMRRSCIVYIPRKPIDISSVLTGKLYDSPMTHTVVERKRVRSACSGAGRAICL
jgi:hypothetical protein